MCLHGRRHELPELKVASKKQAKQRVAQETTKRSMRSVLPWHVQTGTLQIWVRQNLMVKGYPMKRRSNQV